MNDPNQDPKLHPETTGDDAYLWDRSGPTDPDVASLERTLSVLRYDDGGATDAARPAVSRLSTRWLGIAAILVMAVGVTWMVRPSPPPVASGNSGGGKHVGTAWAVQSLGGSAVID